jgi:hypothetical protein
VRAAGSLRNICGLQAENAVVVRHISAGVMARNMINRNNKDLIAIFAILFLLQSLAASDT